MVTKTEPPDGKFGRVVSPDVLAGQILRRTDHDMGFEFRPGSTPLLISMPHNSSVIPPDIAATMTDDGRSSRDTDWFLDRLYDLPETKSASFLVAKLSRYVIDFNRPRDDQSLYPGQTTTGLIPTECFDGAAIYDGAKPDPEETARRIRELWIPYHDQLEREFDRLVAEYGQAVLLEAHSIASVLPRLFDGRIPDFNLGTNHSSSCDAALERKITEVLRSQSKYTHVVNGRFIGGYNTRHHGRPGKNRHAVQIELSQATYMDEDSLTWDDQKAAEVQPVFQQIVSAIMQWMHSNTF